jgi:hypothetical protein
MGRILQSFLGWEVAAYGLPKIKFKKPEFIYDKECREAAEYWCGAAAARILIQEQTRASRPRSAEIRAWASHVMEKCNVTLRDNLTGSR